MGRVGKATTPAVAQQAKAEACPPFKRTGWIDGGHGAKGAFAHPTTPSSRAFFVELAGDEIADGFDRGLGIRADRGDHDGGPGRRRQHHQPHDRGAAHGFAAARHPDLGVEALDHLDELGRSARVQSTLVDDEKFAGNSACRHARPGDILGRRDVVVHLPASTRLAMVTYLRPASWAMAMASGSERSSRTLASLTSMGRLMPASTSTLGRLMQEIARLEGVPPNMSVRMATPSPLSTRLTASIMSLRHKSESSSAPIVTASICFCGPITCSSAALNSSARRPWVTSTRPIIGNSSRVLFGAPHERATLTIQSPRARGDVCGSPLVELERGGATPVYSVAIVGLIWLPIPFKQSSAWLPEDELSVVVRAATTSGRGE